MQCFQCNYDLPEHFGGEVNSVDLLDELWIPLLERVASVSHQNLAVFLPDFVAKHVRQPDQETPVDHLQELAASLLLPKAL